MVLDDLQTKYRYQMPGFMLLAGYEAGIPVYRTRLQVEVLVHQEMPAPAEFALKVISCGLTTEQEIGAALGLGERFVRDALSYLDRQQLIVQEYQQDPSPHVHFSVSTQGLTALGKSLSSYTTNYLEIQVDGLTGKIERLDPELMRSGEEVPKHAQILLNPASGARPVVSTLNQRLNDVRSIFRAENGNDEQEDLVSVTRIERSWLIYRAVNVLLFRQHESEELHFRVFSGYEPMPEYDMVLARLDRQGTRVVPDDLLVSAVDAGSNELTEDIQPHIVHISYVEEQIQEVVLKQERALQSLEVSPQQDGGSPAPIITERTKRIAELERRIADKDLEAKKQIDQLKEREEQIVRLQAQQGKSRVLHVSEHRPLLQKALQSAQQFVLIISPWINRAATDQPLIKMIARAIERDVVVLIGYGITPRPGETRKDALDPYVESQFEQIKSGANGANLQYVYFADTHQKILICDRTFCVVTSLNWLSYRGDKGIRQETGIYSEDLGLIDRLARTLLPRFPNGKELLQPID
jgi:hypothetical protein